MHRIIATTIALFLVSGAAVAQGFEKRNYNHSEFAKGAFSEVVTVTGPAKFIWLAGIGSEDENDGSVRPQEPLDHINASQAERHKLTMRMQMRRFTPAHQFLPKESSRTTVTRWRSISFWRNSVRAHKAHKLTPAMAAGLATSQIEMTDVLR